MQAQISNPTKTVFVLTHTCIFLKGGVIIWKKEYLCASIIYYAYIPILAALILAVKLSGHFTHHRQQQNCITTLQPVPITSKTWVSCSQHSRRRGSSSDVKLDSYTFILGYIFEGLIWHITVLNALVKPDGQCSANENVTIIPTWSSPCSMWTSFYFFVQSKSLLLVQIEHQHTLVNLEPRCQCMWRWFCADGRKW